MAGGKPDHSHLSCTGLSCTGLSCTGLPELIGIAKTRGNPLPLPSSPGLLFFLGKRYARVQIAAFRTTGKWRRTSGRGRRMSA